MTLPKSDKSINKVHTTDELAKLANVGHTAYHQAKTILDSDNKEIKNDVLTGKSSPQKSADMGGHNVFLLGYIPLCRKIARLLGDFLCFVFLF